MFDISKLKTVNPIEVLEAVEKQAEKATGYIQVETVKETASIMNKAGFDFARATVEAGQAYAEAVQAIFTPAK
jgi:hypothetical protein